MINSFTLSDLKLPNRVPVRPIELRQENFDCIYDSETACYDMFNGSRGFTIICPPLEYHEVDIVINQLQLNLLPAKEYKYKVYRSKKITKIIFDGLFARSAYMLGREICLAEKKFIEPSNSRVLYTLQKDNSIEWIRHYINWYIDTQKIDFVVIYDNNSSIYSAVQLSDALSDLRCPVYVHTFDFKYGPGAFKGSSWDSDYCQYAAFEHVRYLLPENTLLFNFDIDELLVSSRIDCSYADSISFRGRWAFIENGFDTEYTHEAHRFIEKEATCPCKWVINISSVPDSAFLQVHNMYGHSFEVEEKTHFYIHFRGVSNNWKSQRTRGFQFNSDEHIRIFSLSDYKSI